MIEAVTRFKREGDTLHVGFQHGGEWHSFATQSPSVLSFFGMIECRFRELENPGIELSAQAAVETEFSDRVFVRRVYDLTTRFYTKTGHKVQIQDLLDAFFAPSMKDVEQGDQEAFEQRLTERLEAQVPGWDK